MRYGYSHDATGRNSGLGKRNHRSFLRWSTKVLLGYYIARVSSLSASVKVVWSKRRALTMNQPPSVLQTPGFAHYSLAWSPFHTSRLALASAANFGLVGNGRLHLVSVTPVPGGLHGLNLEKQYVQTYCNYSHSCMATGMILRMAFMMLHGLRYTRTSS